MPRILYLLPTGGSIQGGHKIIVRHVEALRRLGFDACCVQGAQHTVPAWFDHDAPFATVETIRDDDTIVSPDDAQNALTALSKQNRRVFVLAQNPYYFALLGFEALDLFPPQRLPTFLAVSPGLKHTIQRAYPGANVEFAPCFADERIFKPGPEKSRSIIYAPRKRPLEAKMIRAFFRKYHPRHADFEWIELSGEREPGVARAMAGASLFLSLSRMESVGMTPLEAMASGCICAGYPGIGGLQYTTPENGFWATDDDCEAAADALARAADVVKDHPDRVAAYRIAGATTAEHWSYRRFEEHLEAVWARLAPDARMSAA